MHYNLLYPFLIGFTCQMLRHLYTDLDKNAKLPFYFQDYNSIPHAESNMQHNEVTCVQNITVWNVYVE